MRNFTTGILVSVVLSVAASPSFAALITYNITGHISGSPVSETNLGSYAFDAARADSKVSETLPSGTKHIGYVFSGYVTFDPGSPPPTFLFNIVDVGSPFADAQMQIDQYLNSDGSSSLLVSGSSDPGCHGGCLIDESFSLTYASSGPGLFGDLSKPLKFSALSSSEGQSVYSFTDFPSPDESFTSAHDFTIASTTAVVPETDSWMLLFTGLVLGAYRLRRTVVCAKLH